MEGAICLSFIDLKIQVWNCFNHIEDKYLMTFYFFYTAPAGSPIGKVKITGVTTPF